MRFDTSQSGFLIEIILALYYWLVIPIGLEMFWVWGIINPFKLIHLHHNYLTLGLRIVN